MYQVLARKYRPRNFNELVGQNHVSRALTSALERGRLHHAYLFTGTRGVGKTTIARILAKCLNCETGVTATPCETCATCKAVNEGRFIDLIEIDAASRTKVEDTRELLDNVPYAPTQGRYKVYLIDEVHMLSTHSFNALLKTLEEPPAHVKFLFATTDPQKLPITVISRCLQFTLRPLVIDEITGHLSQILATEQIQAEPDALWQIAEAAQGSLRDALSLTDQAIAYGQGAIHYQDVKEMLGLIDRSLIYDLILAIHQNQTATVSQLLLQFRQQAIDVALVLDQLISTLHELALMQYLPDLSLQYSSEINQKIKQLATIISAQDLQLYYQISCKGRADLQVAVTQEQGFEMTVLRLLAFRPLAVTQVVVPATAQSAAIPVVDMAPEHKPSQILDQTPQQNQLQQATIEHVTTEQAQPIVDAAVAVETPAVEAQVVLQEQEDAVQQEQAAHLTDMTDRQSDEQHSVISAADVDQADALALTHFDDQIESAPIAEAMDIHHMSDQELFFLAPSDDAVTTHVEKHDDVPADHAPADVDSVVEVAVAARAADMPTPVEIAPIADVTVSTKADGLMPQQILSLAEQQLDGQWDTDKWEYWFRNSSLSPAGQELAQHGLMSGEINGVSVFRIPQQYEKLFAQTQHDLQQALTERWPETRFSVEYQEVTSATPYTLLQQRKQHAYVRAVELLQQEKLVKQLVQAFDAELHEVRLK